MGLHGVCGLRPCRWVLLELTHLGRQGGARGRGGGWPVLGARKGTEASGPRDLHAQALWAPGVMAPTFSPVGPAQSLRPARRVHMHTCTFQAKTHAQRHMHAHTPACARSAMCTHVFACWPCTTGLAKQQSEHWGTWAPGRQASPGCLDQGPSLSFPVWRVGRNGSRASWDSPRGEPEHRAPRAPLHSWCPRVPSSLPAAPALPASLKGFGPPTRWMSAGDGQCPALSSSLPSVLAKSVGSICS